MAKSKMMKDEVSPRVLSRSEDPKTMNSRMCSLRSTERILWIVVATLASPLLCLSDDFSFSGHIKYQPTLSFLPSDTFERDLGPDVVHGQQVDLRVNTEYRKEKFAASLHGETLALGGTAVELKRNRQLLFPGQNASRLDDHRRFFDLSHQSTSDDQFEMFHRIDRAELGYYGDQFVSRIGRQTFSAGNGLAFQVLDLLNPFSPTEIDKDYKTGEDLFYTEYLLGQENRIETVVAPGRDLRGNVSHEESSYAVVVHSSTSDGSSDFQFLAAEHYRDWNFGLGSSTDVSESVLRVDLLFTRGKEEDTDWSTSLVGNIDTSWTVFGLNAYSYLEYYRNGFGIANKRYREADEALLTRLDRGEIFVLGRDLVSLGGRLEISPLWSLFVNQILSVNDGSQIHQTRAEYNLAQDMLLLIGATIPFGGNGTEFGGYSIQPGIDFAPASQLYLRLSYFF
ncbi:MAG: hypothetical protein KDD64_09735 [Bdellovibrionales bacterium]|nr:hypothetical protein [Bdellovibrionales bacterium]